MRVTGRNPYKNLSMLLPGFENISNKFIIFHMPNIFVPRMQRTREIVLVAAIGVVLIILLTFSLTPRVSASSENNRSEKDLSIIIQTPQYVSLRSPFCIHISLNNSEPMRLKFSLVSSNGKHAAQLWNGTKWVYPGGSWNSMLVIPPQFSDFLYLDPRESYSGWKELQECEAAFISVTIRYLNSTSNIKSSTGVGLINDGLSNGTQGFRISGTIYHLEEPLEEGIVLVRPSYTNTTNSTIFQYLASLTITSSRIIRPDHENPGSYELWIPPDNFTIYIYSNTNMDKLLYSRNVSIKSNMTIDFGTPPPPPSQLPGNNHPMIIEVYFNTYGGGSDEYIALHNSQNTTVNFTGWTLTDGELTCTLPLLSLEPGGIVLIARNPEELYHLTGMTAQVSYSLSLGNEKDSISLYDRSGQLIDAVCWGGELVPSWEGELDSISSGRVIRRNRIGIDYIDTDSAEDWLNDRTFMVGQSDLPFTTVRFSGDVSVFVSPDCSYETLRSEFENASECIFINVYEFTNIRLMDELLMALNRSVEIQLFLEGGPVGGVSETELFISNTLVQSGAQVRFIHNNATVKDRYNYNHAKYAVIDHRTLIIESENWKTSGIPVEPTYGNRGWGVVVRNSEIAQYFEQVLQDDSDPVFYDVMEFGNDPYLPPANYTAQQGIKEGTYVPKFPLERMTGEFSITPVLGPDHTIREDAILGLINNARSSVYIQQLQCPINWGQGTANSYLETAIDAAMRGCEVRILLDSRYVNSLDNTSDNLDTVNYLNEIANAQGLVNLKAKLAVLKGISKVHNKGIIVDGEYTLVSSINWGRGAVFLNREAGIIIRNPAVASYFTEVFFYDWNVKETKNECQGQGLSGTGSNVGRYSCCALSILAGVAAGIFIRLRN